jgi:hypothetical protein
MAGRGQLHASVELLHRKKGPEQTLEKHVAYVMEIFL